MAKLVTLGSSRIVISSNGSLTTKDFEAADAKNRFTSVKFLTADFDLVNVMFAVRSIQMTVCRGVYINNSIY
jgi:hypothetical protein